MTRNGPGGRPPGDLSFLAAPGALADWTEGRDADWLAEQLAPLRAQIRALLEQCAAGSHARTANFAAGLLEEYEALWTFADVPQAGIDPTNNAGERAVRHAVLMRKIQGGTQSERGSRWIERIQSVRETLSRTTRIPRL